MTTFALPTRADLTAARVRRAIERVAAGGMVIVVDDPDRENEGDLIAAAELVTPETVNFMAVHGRGLICAPVSGDRLRELRIPPMHSSNADPLGTAFHVGVDHRDAGTGISAADRALTIRALANPAATAADFRMPGHVFPLAAQAGGVLARAGHTEAAVDLARLAGLSPAAVICEIAAQDGNMARQPELNELAAKHELPMITIAELRDYRSKQEKLVERVVETTLPVRGVRLRIIGYRSRPDGAEHVVLINGNPGHHVEIHKECVPGDVLGSTNCNCAKALDNALNRITSGHQGSLIYLRNTENNHISKNLNNPNHTHQTEAEKTTTTQILNNLGISRSTS